MRIFKCRNPHSDIFFSKVPDLSCQMTANGYVLRCLFARLILGTFFWLLKIVSKGQIRATNEFADLSPLAELVIIGFLVPLFEVAIFQFAVIELILKLNSQRKFIPIGASAILFSLGHFQSPLHLVSSLASGILYAKCYVDLRSDFNHRFPAIPVFVIHCSYNFIAFGINRFF